jgi:hypothetical protein
VLPFFYFSAYYTPKHGKNQGAWGNFPLPVFITAHFLTLSRIKMNVSIGGRAL